MRALRQFRLCVLHGHFGIIYVFYCDAGKSGQKGCIVCNHHEMRRILVKGVSFDSLTQKAVNLVLPHVNSYHRLELGGMIAFEMMRFCCGEAYVASVWELGLVEISAEEGLRRKSAGSVSSCRGCGVTRCFFSGQCRGYAIRACLQRASMPTISGHILSVDVRKILNVADVAVSSASLGSRWAV